MIQAAREHRARAGEMPACLAGRLAVSVVDVQQMIGGCRSKAYRLIKRLEDAGLKRKGKSRSTMYDSREFWRLWQELDDRR